MPSLRVLPPLCPLCVCCRCFAAGLVRHVNKREHAERMWTHSAHSLQMARPLFFTASDPTKDGGTPAREEIIASHLKRLKTFYTLHRRHRFYEQQVECPSSHSLAYSSLS